MDIRERIIELGGTESLEEIFRSFVQSEMRNTWTAMPVKVMKDSDGKAAMIQPTIKAQVRDAEGKTSHVDMPMVEGIVHFMGGGGATSTFPIKEGDEGIVLFASRAIDAWHQSGGMQQAVDTRSHHLSDGMFLPGIRSKPRDLKNINTEAHETRSDDGKHIMQVHPKNGTMMSVENGKHTTSWHPEKGIAIAAENGKHLMSLTGTGISLKTASKLAIDAAEGLGLKGALSVDGKVTSTKSIGAPALQGALGGFTGAALALMMAWGLWTSTGASTPTDGILQARYALAAWVQR